MQGEGRGNTLRDSLLKSRIAKLPHLPAIAPGRAQEGSSSSSLKTQSGSREDGTAEDEDQDSLGELDAPRLTSRSRRHGKEASVDAFSPTTAKDCFAEALEVEVGGTDGGDEGQPKSTFRVYYTPARARASRVRPSDILRGAEIDGQGASFAADSFIDEDDEQDQSTNGPGTVFVLHHGAGYSALSFALVAKRISDSTQDKVGVLAYDCRGHGRTAHDSDEDGRDLSLARLTSDGLAILNKLFPPSKPQPSLILVGHSMGGAVVVSMAHALADPNAGVRSNKNAFKVTGVAVLDVVEGTAIEALPGMRTIVSQLPKGFPSVSEAIRWHVDSGTIVNLDSARRSVPSLLRKNESFMDNVTEHTGTAMQEPIEEMRDASTEATTLEDPGTTYPFVWRHDLLSTEPHWRGWFEGLSAAFLSVKCARLLLLAGTDRLDKDLMIGQMQGKYQLVVFQDVGHSLQEDAPERTADTLIEFWRRNEALDITAIRGLRKVGQP